jgi:hypothetical protein
VIKRPSLYPGEEKLLESERIRGTVGSEEKGQKCDKACKNERSNHFCQGPIKVRERAHKTVAYF